MKFNDISSISRRGFSLSLLSTSLVSAKSSKSYKNLDVLGFSYLSFSWLKTKTFCS